MTRVGRRGFLRTTGVAGAAVAVGVFPRRASAQETKGAVRFAYLQSGWGVSAIIHREGLLGRRGWQAEVTAAPGAAGSLAKSFAAGSFDASELPLGLAAKLFESGVSLKVTGVATTVLGAIVVRRDGGMRRVEDLKGRSIAALVSTAIFFDIRMLVLKGYGLDLEKDARIVPVQSPREMTGAMAKREVDAIVAWQPVSDQVVRTGSGVYLAKELDLWRKATGRETGYPVHACYVVTAKFIDSYPAFPEDLNAAQKEAVDIWYKNKARALEILRETTKLPMGVLDYAHGQTAQLPHGLSDQQIDTVALQLRMSKESTAAFQFDPGLGVFTRYEGPTFLRSDFWDNPERIRSEFVWRAGV